MRSLHHGGVISILTAKRMRLKFRNKFSIPNLQLNAAKQWLAPKTKANKMENVTKVCNLQFLHVAGNNKVVLSNYSRGDHGDNLGINCCLDQTKEAEILQGVRHVWKLSFDLDLILSTLSAHRIRLTGP